MLCRTLLPVCSAEIYSRDRELLTVCEIELRELLPVCCRELLPLCYMHFLSLDRELLPVCCSESYSRFVIPRAAPGLSVFKLGFELELSSLGAKMKL